MIIGHALLHRLAYILLLSLLLSVVAPGPSLSQTNTKSAQQSESSGSSDAGETPALQGVRSQQQADAAYQKGMQLLGEKRYAEALGEFQIVEQIAPRIPQGPSGEGIALALMGRPEEAVQSLKKALEIDPSFWVARRELGIVEWHLGRKEEGAKELRQIVEQYPNDEAANSILGQYEFDRQNYAQALAFLAKASAQVEADPRLAIMEASAFLKTGEVQPAHDKLQRLAGRPGLSREESFQLAWLLGEAKLYKLAIEAFNSLPDDYPNRFTRNYGLALAYFEDEQYSKSAGVLKQLQTLGITRPELFSLLGVAEEKAGHTKEAYDAFREGILVNPRDPQNYLNIATLASQHLNYDLAIQILSSGMEVVPGSHELVLSRGIAYTLKAQFAQAHADYERAIQLAPQDPANYVALGISQLEEGDLDHAIGAFKKAGDLGSKDPQSYYFVAEALIQKGVEPETPPFQQARQATDTALSLDPNFAYAYLDRARLSLRVHETDAALQDLERAQALDPKSQSIAYLLAQTYQQKGEKEKAERLFASVKESSDREARQFRESSLTQALVVISSNDRSSSSR
jgi:tetratricopeptide (TPR) repeat protein